jgi:hypothetical protein
MCHTTKLKQAAMPCQATHAMQSYPFEPSKFDEQKNTKYQKITSLNNNNKKRHFHVYTYRRMPTCSSFVWVCTSRRIILSSCAVADGTVQELQGPSIS